MKKRTVVWSIVLSMVLSLSACGERNSAEETQPVTKAESTTEESTETEVETEAVSGSNVLVAYFSRVGVTDLSGNVEAVSSASINAQDGTYIGNAEVLANMVAEKTGGDVFQIITEEVYPTDYRATTNQASEEQSNDARPALSSHVENMSQYDTVFLIYPNWWGTLPMPVYTFLEEYDFSGKIIAPLATHEGSGLGSSEGTIQSLVGDTVTLLDGLSVRGGAVFSAQSDVDSWIDGMDLPEVAGIEAEMEMTLGENIYTVVLNDNVTVEKIKANMPLDIEMVRYAGHEYYGELPFTPVMAAEKTSEIKAGHVYYWDGWNAFVINYEDMDISPYQVVHLGEVTDNGISESLKTTEDNVNVHIALVG
ncbi:MAG: hypothetical protein EOM34_03535 [Clostridia bacterium]|nr:hypothetical protein [Clostridia bacterium]